MKPFAVAAIDVVLARFGEYGSKRETTKYTKHMKRHKASGQKNRRQKDEIHAEKKSR